MPTLDVFPLKSKFEDLGIVKGSENRTFSVKYYKNMKFFGLGWQPALPVTSTRL
jgi:hypothetical protein